MSLSSLYGLVIGNEPTTFPRDKQMTALSANQIAQLTAALTGGGMKRSATKDAAAKRFRTVAAETGAFGAEAVEITLTMDFAEAQRTIEAIKAGIDMANNPARKTSPGLARLRASENAEAIRAATAADAEAARAAVVESIPGGEPNRFRASVEQVFGGDPLGFKAARGRKATLNLGVEPEEKPAKIKPEKLVKAEGSQTRMKVGTDAVIEAVVANPKKAGSKSFAIFALYAAGQTVEDFTRAVIAAGYSESDAKGNLSWDRRKGFITVGNTKTAETA